ncbi:MAG: hypothetical protein HZC55_07570 [Verrucomicrobia bacterium]|nr:hypothetical protein [Verrucomicrobiota bacterium]
MNTTRQILAWLLLAAGPALTRLPAAKPADSAKPPAVETPAPAEAGVSAAATAPDKTPAKVAPPPLFAARFKQVEDRVGALFRHRREAPPTPDPRHNPFLAPGSAAATTAPRPAGDPPNKLPEGAAPAADAGPATSLTQLQQAAATLKVSGIFETGGGTQLVINKRLYKEGDVVQAQVGGETVYLRVKEIGKRNVTLSLNDAEMTLKF